MAAFAFIGQYALVATGMTQPLLVLPRADTVSAFGSMPSNLLTALPFQLAMARSWHDGTRVETLRLT